jgi:hypothetical protein
VSHARRVRQCWRVRSAALLSAASGQRGAESALLVCVGPERPSRALPAHPPESTVCGCRGGFRPEGAALAQARCEFVYVCAASWRRAEMGVALVAPLSFDPSAIIYIESYLRGVRAVTAPSVRVSAVGSQFVRPALRAGLGGLAVLGRCLRTGSARTEVCCSFLAPSRVLTQSRFSLSRM